MELNSLLMLLEAAEYLERRDREAEHGYASVLPFDGDFARKKTKAAGLVRKAANNRSSHNELEKHRQDPGQVQQGILGGLPRGGIWENSSFVNTAVAARLPSRAPGLGSATSNSPAPPTPPAPVPRLWVWARPQWGEEPFESGFPRPRSQQDTRFLGSVSRLCSASRGPWPVFIWDGPLSFSMCTRSL
ncbi:max dimerization protein 4 isoform X2 [Choloepus didactylus]|uniref:max dimerization protein 4 isoform X2 n=1 Tax=Choloepus didactylus TaxID=27675 RepID=UPI0018A055F1|nr:max dimerization protein 4 isoform X2 [Choloepus didactylus]